MINGKIIDFPNKTNLPLKSDKQIRERVSDDVAKKILNRLRADEDKFTSDIHRIQILEERIATQQILREKGNGKYLSFMVGCYALLGIGFMILNIPNKYSLIVFLPFAVGGIFSGIRAGKIKLGLPRIDREIKAATDLVVDLMEKKIKKETEKQTWKKAKHELRSE